MDPGLPSPLCLLLVHSQFFLSHNLSRYRKRRTLYTQSINQMRFTVYYQRATVMFSEIPYLLVLFWIFKEINRKLVIAYFAIPFIILDNIHFQYNIIMQAIFLGSIQLIRKGSYLKGAFVYAILLNFKHIYLYSALAFFAYILKEYVLRGQSIKQKVTSLCKVAIATIIPFLISFLPFILKGGVGQIGQIMSRLFPFQRGLIHDYWAPNFWALYYFLDKLLNLIFSKLGLQPITIRQASQLHSLTNLPQIPAALTTLIILLATLPLLYVYFKNKRIRFEYLVFLCGSIFFMFGFHVHQKAITPYIGLLLVFSREEEEQQQLVDSAVFVNIVNLLPLLLQPNQKLLRMVVPLLWLSIWERKRQLSYALEFSVVAGGLGVVAFHQMLHPLIFRSRMEFLPLMLNSLYSSVFNLSWIFKLYHQQLTKIQQKDEYNSLPSSSLEQ